MQSPSFDPGLTQKYDGPLRRVINADGSFNMVFGYMNRNQLVGPGRNNFDLALLKDFITPWFKGEHSTVQLRIESFNTFNHPQFNAIKASCSGNTPFGGPCNDSNNVGNGEVTGAWSPRNMQFALKFSF